MAESPRSPLQPSARAFLRLSARQVIEAVQDAVVVADPHGTIQAVNRAFTAVTGYSSREAVGRNPRMLQSGRHGRLFYAMMWSSLLRKGSWRGEIWNRRKDGRIYPEWLAISAVKDAKGQLVCYLGVFSDITVRKTSEEQMNRLVQYDSLTGLPNRRLFGEKLRRAMGSPAARRQAAVLFLDLDHFKEINDHWGHAAGDLFLRAVGARLDGCVRRTDVVARWAGDEFLVLLTPIGGRQDVVRVVRKILRVLNRTFILHGHKVRTAASIGVCLLDERTTPAEAVRRADRAMYAVKKLGRNGFLISGDES
jgi:diguanylate cyclase (GGDEF)-like protein/PAS domain S-box-containing protein